MKALLFTLILVLIPFTVTVRAEGILDSALWHEIPHDAILPDRVDTVYYWNPGMVYMYDSRRRTGFISSHEFAFPDDFRVIAIVDTVYIKTRDTVHWTHDTCYIDTKLNHIVDTNKKVDTAYTDTATWESYIGERWVDCVGGHWYGLYLDSIRTKGSVCYRPLNVGHPRMTHSERWDAAMRSWYETMEILEQKQPKNPNN